MLGKKQSGMPSFLIADLSVDEDLLNEARNFIDEINIYDPKFKTKQGKNLKNLLYLYQKDVALKTLLAG